jgi:L-2-hydroxyglutarate oxidase LhgO
MTEQVETVVIGAGVVGLAVAKALAEAGQEVLVLEEAEAIGTHTSSRNSEVIHAGIYYPTGSRKAHHCVRGKHLLYEYCASHGVPHMRITKLIAAVDGGQANELDRLKGVADANGVRDLQLLDARQSRTLEPAVRASAALLSPSTGIIDSHALMLAYQGDAEDHGAMLAYFSRVESGEVQSDGIDLRVSAEGEIMTLHAKRVVNAAGLFATEVASRIDGIDARHIPTPYYAKGNYFTLAGKAPFTRLIYPLPEPGGLGVHVTLDMGGGARFGPDVEWQDGLDYNVDPARCERFYPAVRSWYPELEDGALQPAYAGIRPKISAPGEPAADFLVQGPDVHGVPGLVNLFGIESPGLTASLSIAEEVKALLEG